MILKNGLKKKIIFIYYIFFVIVSISLCQPILAQLPTDLNNLAQASVLLNISAQALEHTPQGELQPADMVSLIQLLSLTADIPIQPPTPLENSSQDGVLELSQHFVSVADSIICDENRLKWQAIKEVKICFFFFLVLNMNPFVIFAAFLWTVQSTKPPRSVSLLFVTLTERNHTPSLRLSRDFCEDRIDLDVQNNCRGSLTGGKAIKCRIV